MLGKLLKYDLKYIIKSLMVFYILSLVFAILTRMFISIDNSFMFSLIGAICRGVSISMMFNVAINNIIRMWVRFKDNIYKDESYLTHTLPVTKKDIYLSKILASIISLLISFTIILITLYISCYSKENIALVKSLLLPLANVFDSTMFIIIIVFLFIVFLEFACVLQAGYTGTILGHKMSSNKVAYSFLFGYLSYMAISIIALLVIFIISLFNDNLMNLFHTTQMIDMDTLKVVIFIGIFYYIAIFIVNYIVNVKLFEKGVNID